MPKPRDDGCIVILECPHCDAAVEAGQGPYWGVMTAASGEAREWTVGDGSGAKIHRCIVREHEPKDALIAKTMRSVPTTLESHPR